MRRWLLCPGVPALGMIGGVSAAATAGTLAGLLARMRLPGAAPRVAEAQLGGPPESSKSDMISQCESRQ